MIEVAIPVIEVTLMLAEINDSSVYDKTPNIGLLP